MALATVSSARLHGDHGVATTIEVHVGPGLPSFTVVGLPDSSCRETRDRVRSAFLSSKLSWPLQRITVNVNGQNSRLGASHDVGIAIGIAIATGQLEQHHAYDITFVGELGLDGTVRGVPGIVALVHDAPTPAIVIPASQHATPLIDTQLVLVAESLTGLIDSLKTGEWPQPKPAPTPSRQAPVVDISTIKGNALAVRALTIAATGHHSLFLQGPAGSGNTVIAEAIQGILPALGDAERLDVARIHSAAMTGRIDTDRRPFRAPRHDASSVAMFGGGSLALRPGEVSCAHHGVLCLNELNEYAPAILDGLSQPLAYGHIRIDRASASVTLPARFLLIATAPRCGCDQTKCCCSSNAKQRYQRRLSGPLMKRFDLRIATGKPATNAKPYPWTSTELRDRVGRARGLAWNRQHCLNSELTVEQLDEVARLSSTSSEVLEHALRTGTITHRSVGTIRRVERTIADLANNTSVVLADDDVTEAMHMHRLPPNPTTTPPTEPTDTTSMNKELSR
jgi:magnesium chelatase family protein